MSEADRQLMINADTPSGGTYNFDMMKVPPELQDQILAGLDSRTMTFAEAAALLKTNGVTLSEDSIRRWYRVVRALRRQYDIGVIVMMQLEKCRDMNEPEMRRCLRLAAMAATTAGLLDGSAKLRSLDVSKLLEDPADPEAARRKAIEDLRGGRDAPIDVTPETKKRIHEDVYGLPQETRKEGQKLGVGIKSRSRG